jgi:hypothetical protein
MVCASLATKTAAFDASLSMLHSIPANNINFLLFVFLQQSGKTNEENRGSTINEFGYCRYL